MTRRISLFSVLTVLAMGLGIPAASSMPDRMARSHATKQLADIAVATGPDFNGDGFSDLSVGAYLEDLGTVADAGQINVLYGSAGGPTATGDQLWNQASPGVIDVPEAGDGFGFVQTFEDFNGDGFDDVAIGDSGEDVGTIADAGAVSVLYGSATGLSAIGNQLWTQDSPGILDDSETTDNFGERLSAADFNGDGFGDLAIGVNGEDVGTIGDAGAVNVLYGSAAGLTATGNQLWTQDSPGILDDSEASDFFGGPSGAGDFNGDGFEDLVVCAYLEDVGTVVDAGAVNVLYGSAAGLTAAGNQLWTQNSPGILDAAETGDEFGFPPSAGDFNGDGFADVALGAYFEDLGNVVDAGGVHVIYGSAAGLTATGNQFWTQASPGILDAPEAGDILGSDRASGDFNGDGFTDFAVGLNGEDVGTIVDAGAASVWFGSAAGLAALGNQFWTQDNPGVLDGSETGDSFGGSIAR